MIVTKAWLNEFLDLSDISTEKICETLNAIGLEVDSLTKISVPEGVVIGQVLSCEKHPDADKLNVCQVDLGSETKQIVCGAKNVAAGQVVAVATVGANLGGDFVIKEAKLRGVDSHGMICGASEIGLPTLNDGIWVLDESIGRLTLGTALASLPLVNDEVIDIELTANRGDCLSIYGVARDLSSALDIPLREVDYHDSVGSAMEMTLLHDDFHSALMYQKLPSTDVKTTALIDLRLGFVELYHDNAIQRLVNYTTQATGVLLRLYHDSCQRVEVREDSEGLLSIYCGEKILSRIGVNQLQCKEKAQMVEASYIHPDVVSKAVMGKKCEKDELFYRASRGSESDLKFGLDYLATLMDSEKLPTVATKQLEKFSTTVEVSFSKINNFIGQDIAQDKIVAILEKLRFQLTQDGDILSIRVPTFRHDINNEQDVIEEIVRIVGIDNIASKAFAFAEKSRFNDAYTLHSKKIHFRHKAAGSGFFEAVHYFFDNREKMLSYKLPVIDEAVDVANPINSDLNTLRTTLLLHMLESSSKNLKHGKKSIALFEVGRVVDSKRDEHQRMAFIFSGEVEAPSVHNHGKPKAIDFLTFASKVRSVIGAFELVVAEDENLLANPYENARIMIEGEDVGFMARVHIDVERTYDLPATYICEVDFDALVYQRIIAKPYSKFPALSRDISLLIPKEMKFGEMRSFLEEVAPKEVVNFYPIDIYHDRALNDKASLTVRFILQSEEKTMDEEMIVGIMERILTALKEKFALEMR
jgi:phenylalanyl-tRNA synthetase beta chain